jgi:hypothetical protein
VELIDSLQSTGARPDRAQAGHLIAGALFWAKHMIEKLASIPFDPTGLAKHADLEALFSIIPDRDLKEELLQKTVRKDYNVLPKRNRETQRMADVIAGLPFHLGGHEALRVFQSHWRDQPSMYDFVNIFTEHANGLPHGQRIDVQAKAGSLATWIAENKRRFS